MTFAKAIVGGLAAAGAVILAALEGADPLVAEDYVKAGIAFLGALSAVWAVPNKGAK